MQLSNLYTLFVLAGLSAAQTPDGFVPQVTPHLDVIFGTKEVTPGLSLTKTGAYSLGAEGFVERMGQRALRLIQLRHCEGAHDWPENSTKRNLCMDDDR